MTAKEDKIHSNNTMLDIKAAANVIAKHFLNIWAYAWCAYDWSSNAANNFSKTSPKGYRGKLFLGFLKLVTLGCAILVVYDISGAISSYTAVSLKTSALCTKQKPWPTILVCPQPYKNRTYGVILNETLVEKIQLTDAEVDTIAEWVFTGIMPKSPGELLKKAEKHSYGSLHALWLAIADGIGNLGDFKSGQHAGKQFLLCDGRGYRSNTGSDGKDCLWRNETSKYCPAYEKADGYTRRLWHMGKKSRCIFMEAHTHQMSQWARLAMWKNYGFWAWYGDFNTTSIDHLFDNQYPKYNTMMVWPNAYEVKNSPQPKPVVCHPELRKDFGEPYPCFREKMEQVKDYWVYETQSISRWTAGFSTFHILSTQLNIGLEEKQAFSTLALSQLFIGVIDLFVGLSAFYICSLLFSLLTFEGKVYSIIRFVAKGVLICLFLGLSAYFVIREWQNILKNWYLISFKTEDKLELHLPTLLIQIPEVIAYYGMLNYTKLNEFGISFTLLQYILLTSRFDLVLDQRAADRAVEVCPDKIRNCSWENPNFFLPFTYSPQDPEELNPVLANIKLAYGSRYEEVTDYHSLLKVLQLEYEMVSQKAAGRILLPHEMELFFKPDLCKVILSCEMAGTKIPDCCLLWNQLNYVEGFALFNDADVVPFLLKQTRSGRRNGFKVTMNVSQLLSATEPSQFHGSIQVGEFAWTWSESVVHLDIFPMSLNTEIRRYDYPFKYRADVSVAEKVGQTVDIGFLKAYVETMPDHDCHTYKVNPAPICEEEAVYRYFITSSQCGCKFCHLVYSYNKSDTSTKCCTAAEAIECVTKKAAYSSYCTDTKGPYKNMLAHRSQEHHYSRLARCDYNSWRKRDPGNELALSKDQTDFLYSMFEFEREYIVTEENYFICPNPCIKHRTQPLINNQWSDLRKSPGIFEINFYYASMTEQQSIETDTFYPWEFAAIFFGAWSVFFNQPLIAIIIEIAAFMKAIWLLASKQITFGSLFEGSNEVEELNGKQKRIIVDVKPLALVEISENSIKSQKPVASTSAAKNKDKTAEKRERGGRAEGEKTEDTKQEVRKVEKQKTNIRRTTSSNSLQAPDVVPRNKDSADQHRAHSALGIKEKSEENGEQADADHKNTTATEEKQNRKRDNDMIDCITVEPAHDQWGLSGASNGKDNPVEKAGKAGSVLLERSIRNLLLGVSIFLSMVLFVGASSFFYIDHSMNAYTQTMNVSVTDRFPAPSVALCLEGDGNIQRIFKESKFACHLKERSVSCDDLFYIFYRLGDLNCILSDHSLMNANDGGSSESEKLDFQLTELSSGQVRTVTLAVWLGDLGSLTRKKVLQPMFYLEPDSSISFEYSVNHILKAPSSCHQMEMVRCGDCSLIQQTYADTYVCCMHGNGDMRIANVFEDSSKPPCDSYQFLIADIETKVFNTSALFSRFSLKKSKSILTTYQTNDRFSARGIFIILSTYWGMLVGLSLFQMATSVIYGLVILVLRKVASIKASRTEEKF